MVYKTALARERHELLGESLRNIGILMVVFVPLDAIIQAPVSITIKGGQVFTAPVDHHWGMVTVFAIIGAGLIWLGMELESRKQQ
jgi:hypothetical protein